VCETDESRASQKAVIGVFSYLGDGHNNRLFSLFSQFFVTPQQNDNLRGRESTNGRKTAVMDATGFVRVSLGSSTVQFHDSLGSRHECASSEAGFSSEYVDRA
jgi:hypothetical protein